jgi:hypothetical protein
VPTATRRARSRALREDDDVGCHPGEPSPLSRRVAQVVPKVRLRTLG